MEGLKHVCRLCNKRYPSGKSLGGHMRSHVIAGHYVSVHKLKNSKKLLHNNGGQQIIKKKGLDSTPNKQETRVCKRCGKSFQSLKALCGHMSCHSDKGRNFQRFDEEDEDEDEYRSWASEDESQSDNVVADSISIENENGNGCSSNLNFSSEVEQEQEELALCLMMLSRDSGRRIGFNLSTESSDNNSFILESGSSPTLMNKRKNLDSEMDNSDSGYFENGAKELESVDSADGYAGKFDSGSGFGYNVHDAEIGRRPKEIEGSLPNSTYKKYKCSVCEKRFKTHQALGGHIITHRRDSNGIRHQEPGESSANTRNRNPIPIPRPEIRKSRSHCCPFCPKVFRSGQALGGHKRSHLMGCSSEDRANLIQSAAQGKGNGNQHPFLDLNLPAPADEDG